MKILKISTIDTKGGGSKIPWNLMQGLRARGHTVSMFVGYKHSSDPAVHQLQKNPLYYRLSRYFADDLRFSFSDSIFETNEYREADIIHFHNFHSGFFNWKTFDRITREKKTVWTAHDLWPITSGATTSIGIRIQKPQRVLGILWDNGPRMLERKRKTYQSTNFHVVCPSEWIAGQISNSILAHMPRSVIKNGIDTSIFTPINKETARTRLKLPLGKKIILYTATGGLQNWLKGGDYVGELVKRFESNSDFLFISVGNKEIPESETRYINNVIMTGNLSDENLLALYYSAADVLLYPTRGDNCPLVILESMACGTPVVSFQTDGVPEIIASTGYTATPDNLEDLIQGIRYIFSRKTAEYELMSKSCVDRIHDEYSLARMIDEHATLYDRIIHTP